MKRYQIITILTAGAALAIGFALYRNQNPKILQIPAGHLDTTASNVIEQHTRAVRNSPRSSSAWGELGALLKSYEFHDQALYCLRRAEQLDANEARWSYLIGAMLLDESRTDGISKMRKAVQKGGQERPELRIRLAKVLAEGGELEEAQCTLEEGLRILPNHTLTRLMLAHIFQQRGDWQRVEEHARACTQDRQTARGAWKLLSLSYQRAGNSEAAAEADRQAALAPSEAKDPEPYEAEVMLARGDPRWLSDHAHEFMRSGQISEAAALIDRLLKTHPEFPETWLLLGRMQLLQKRPVEAEKSLRRHLALDPQSLNGTFQLGRAVQEQQKFSEAAAAFAHATELKPDFGPAWFNLGACLAKLGRKAEAREPLRQAIRHNPEHIDSYIFLADLYAQAGEADPALDLLNEATAVNANDPRIRSLKRRIETGATQRPTP